MRHEIKAFGPNKNVADPVGVAGVFVTFVALMLTAGTALWPIIIACIILTIALVSGAIYLQCTHVHVDFTNAQWYAWRRYDAIPPEIKRKLPFTRDDFKDIPDSRLPEVERHIRNLVREEEAKREVEDKLNSTSIIMLEELKRVQKETQEETNLLKAVLNEQEHPSNGNQAPSIGLSFRPRGPFRYNRKVYDEW